MGAGIGSAGARLGTGNLVSDFNWKVMAFRCQRRPEGSRRKLFPAYLAWMPDGLVNPIRTNGQALLHLLQFDSFGAGCFTGGQTAFPAELAGALEFVGGGAILDGRRVREVHPKRGKWQQHVPGLDYRRRTVSENRRRV
jgi:hypothetical protein